MAPGATPVSIPGVTTLLRVNGPVLWTWLVAVALGFGVQMGEGLGQPSQGLALSSAALPALLVALTPRRFRRGVMVALVAALALLAVSDAAYHRMFTVYLPLRALLSASQGWAVRDYAWSLLAARDVWVGIVVLVTVAWALWPGGGTAPTAPSLGGRWSVGLPVTLCLLGSVPALAWAWWISPGAADAQTGGFLYAHLADVRRAVSETWMAHPPTDEELARVRTYLQDHPELRPSDDAWAGRASGTNLLMIQVEALNQWLLDADVGGEPVVPFLRSLARRSLSFTAVFDDTHQGRSSDADYLVMASQHPLEHDAVSMVRPTLDPVALPDLLQVHGYTTLSAHAHIPGFWNAAVRHERYGIQTSLFSPELGSGPTVGFGLTDRVFLERALPHIERLQEPWMTWLITLTMHGPHTAVPDDFDGLDLGELEGTPLGNYFLKARHTDDAIRALLDALAAGGVLDATTVVVYGDHTEHQRLDKAWVHRAAGVDGLPADARELLLDRVPFVVALPGQGEPAEVHSVGGLLDVAPTLLHLLGLPPSPSFMGRSLLSAEPGFSAQASGQVVGDGLMWTGRGCHAFPAGSPVASDACDPLRERARNELEVSWLITRMGLGAALVEGVQP